MTQTILEKAQKLREQSIQAALRDGIADKIYYLCLNDPGNIVDDVYTRPLAGSGVFLRYRLPSRIAVAEVSDRPGKDVFTAYRSPAGGWNVVRYRYGIWVEKLLNEYSRVSFKRENVEAVNITDNFGPLGEE